MTSLLTRPHRAVATGAGVALVASLLGASAAQAETFDGSDVYTEGHFDLFYPRIVDGEPELLVNNDGTYLESGNVVFHLKPSVAERTATPDAIAALGIESTDSFYLAPERYAAGQLFMGFGFDTGSWPVDSIDITRTLSNFTYSGPGGGEFALWYSAEGADPLLSTATGDDSYVSFGYHEHANWGFTEEGTYTFDVAATITPRSGAGDAVNVPAQTYTFYVGEELPEDTVPEPGDPEPEPGDAAVSIVGAAGHYHTGNVASLTAEVTGSDADHFHWFTRADASADWTVVDGALTDSYGFVVAAEQQIRAVLYDDDHNVLAESDPVDITIDDHGNTPGVGPELAVSLPETEGALVISVAEGAKRSELSDLTLNAAADRYESTGEIGGITVADTRADSPGWEASGRVRDLVTVDGAVLDGRYLGWTPKVLSAAAGQNVVPGAAVAPGLIEGDGIKGWSSLGSAAVGASTGTAVLGADIRIEAPTTTEIGDYTGIVLITVI